ncbi:MAG TPA: hypothetical protein VEH55_05020 [Gaiellaceae bacterium]|nr:hypothetical protein [Gaiellaceae bacterium]
MSSNNSTDGRPASRRPPWAGLPRRARLLLGLLAALAIGAALVAPVLFRTAPGSSTCAKMLAYKGVEYTARAVPATAFVQSIAIGVGIASGCGSSPANVNVRSVTGIRPTLAIAVPTDQTSLYVRSGTCAGVAAARLVPCLRQR